MNFESCQNICFASEDQCIFFWLGLFVVNYLLYSSDYNFILDGEYSGNTINTLTCPSIFFDLKNLSFGKIQSLDYRQCYSSLV